MALVTTSVFEQARDMLPEFLTYRGMKNVPSKVVGDVYKDKFLYITGDDFFAGLFPDDFTGSVDSAVRRHYKGKDKNADHTIFVIANFNDDLDDDGKRKIVRVGHEQLMVNPLTHVSTGESVLLTQEESDALPSMIKAPLTLLPRVLVDEPVSVWLGAKKGDVIKNKTPTKFGIQEMYYYVV